MNKVAISLHSTYQFPIRTPQPMHDNILLINPGVSEVEFRYEPAYDETEDNIKGFLDILTARYPGITKYEGEPTSNDGNPPIDKPPIDAEVVYATEEELLAMDIGALKEYSAKLGVNTNKLKNEDKIREIIRAKVVELNPVVTE